MKKVISFLLIAFIFISCSKANKSKTSVDGLFINVGAEPQTIDPTLNKASDASVYIIHAFEGLATKNENGELVGGAAESWEILDNGLKFIFHLKTNGKWSDGKPLTASDFVYSWRRAVNPETASEYSYQFEPVKNSRDINAGKLGLDALGIRAIDDYTLEVILEKPTAYFLELTAFPTFYPVREDIIETYGDDWTWKAETYIGNGAYKMVERKPDELIAFEINTNYWDYKNQIAKRINFVLMADEYIALNSVRTGDVDFSITAPPIGEIENLIKDGLMAVSDIIGCYYIDVNTKDKALSDKRVRKALSLAIDRNYIARNIGHGKLIATGGFVPPVVKGLNKSFREESGDYIDINNYAKNIEEAKRLMAEAGYPNGENFPTIELNVGAGFYTTVMEAVQDMWKKNLNVDLRLRTVESKISLPLREAGNYQMVRASWTGDYNDPLTMLQIMTSDSDFNYGGFSNERYDNLIEYARTSIDAEKRMEALREAEAILFDEVPIIPFIYRTDFLVVSPKLKNYTDEPLGRYKFNYAYIEK